MISVGHSSAGVVCLFPDLINQDALGNIVRGARSFGHFEAGVDHADGTDVGEMERELPVICWAHPHSGRYHTKPKSKSDVVRKRALQDREGENAHCLLVCCQ